MRFLTANYIYPLHIDPIKDGILQITNNGEIVSVFSNRELVPKDNLEVFEGVLAPGFVNAHCHLELSHLKLIRNAKGIGLFNFIKLIKRRSSVSKEEIIAKIECAETQMIKNGIVGVGDICNTADSLFQKKKRRLEYYNFVEVFGVEDKNADQIISDAKVLRKQFRDFGMQSTITPHAAYSVPKKLMKEILKTFDYQDKIFSVHMQESFSEIELFKNKSGPFLTWLNNINASPELWEARKNPTDILKELGQKKTLLVHNTFAEKEDISDNYYCTCPTSNLYIENKLPNYSLFNSEKLCVGTDSLASNESLSILKELRIIQENSNFDLQKILKIGSKNGAEALGFSKLGSFEKGKTPGVNLIKNNDKLEVII